jgi:serine/threonine protein kinase
MGAVFEVEHQATGASYALKTILGRPGSDEYQQRVRRFRAEAELSARLDHPGILRVHTFSLEAKPYLVVDLLSGGSLGERLEREGQLPLEEVMDIGLALARALSHAHERGVLHRDLKPDNVMFDELGAVRLVDFGLALEVDRHTRLTKTGAGIGSPVTMAPEQLLGQRGESPALDVYGLAATLHWAAAGEPPIGQGCKSATEVMAAIMRQDPVRLEKLRPEAPPAFSDLLWRGLAKDPLDRPGLEEWIEVLQRSTRDKSAPRPRRRLALLSAAAVLCVGALVVVAAGALQRAPTPSPTTTPATEASRLERATLELQTVPYREFEESLQRTLGRKWSRSALSEFESLSAARRSLQTLEESGLRPWRRQGSARATLFKLEAWRSKQAERFAPLDEAHAKPLAWRLRLQVALENSGKELPERNGSTLPRIVGVPPDRLALCDGAGLSKNMDLRDLESQSRSLARLNAKARVLAYHPSGRVLAAGLGPTLNVIDPSGEVPPKRYRLAERPKTAVSAIDCTQDLIALGYDDGHIDLYGWPPEVPPRPLGDTQGPLSSIAILGPDADRVATCSPEGVTLWRLDGTQVWSYPDTSLRRRITTTPDRTRLLVALPDQRAFVVLRGEDPTPLLRLGPPTPGDQSEERPANRGQPHDLVSSPDGALLFTLRLQTMQDPSRSLCVWDLASGALLASIGDPELPSGVTGLTMTPRGSLALTSLDGVRTQIRVWRLGELLSDRSD